MNRSCLLSAAVAALFIAGCAPMNQKSDEPRSETEHVTGSRLPVRGGSTSSDVKATENKATIDDMMKNRNVVGPGSRTQ